MSFTSGAFALFLPLVFLAYWIIPNKFRWVLLLVSSYYFYMSWNAKYVFLIFMTTLISYFCGILISKSKTREFKNLWLVSALLICLGVLFIFKYFNFFFLSIDNIFRLFSIQLSPITLNLLLPVGISFYTFQTLSYVIDVYKGDIDAELHFGKYATFVSFFPQLVAGPIERSVNLIPQINGVHEFKYDSATYGLKLIAWGYFKKMVIADTLATYVNLVWGNLNNYTGFSLVLIVLFFSFQIYCDFSGYSDIAIGTAKLFDINLMTNFKSPYFSQSIKEFWNRWHISLSTWFKDYIYIPLGGNRCSKLRQSINLEITFLASGLWHGANFTFVLWGGLHGLAQILERFILKRVKIPGCIKLVCVFIFCNLMWVFFRAGNITEAFYVFSNLFVGIENFSSYFYDGIKAIGLDSRTIWIIIMELGILSAFDYFNINNDSIDLISNKHVLIRWPIYIITAVLIILLMPINASSDFIYFQF